MIVTVESAHEILQAARTALSPFPSVAFSFLFGSAVTGHLRPDSDVDLAVYFDSGRALEIEIDRNVSEEADVQIAVEQTTNRNVDLLILNRAPATVCSEALLTGEPVVIRAAQLYSRYFLAVTTLAMDFMETERDYRRILERSASVSETDRRRLLRILDFVGEELKDRDGFREITFQGYQADRGLRRNVDRWVETLINATIDAAKIVLASEHYTMPQTYGQILATVETVEHFSELENQLRILAPLRNLMAHEYLDLRYSRLRKFIDADADGIATFSTALEQWVELQSETQNGNTSEEAPSTGRNEEQP